MNTEYIERFFDEIIRSWMQRLKSYYINGSYVKTNQGEKTLNPFLAPEKRTEICDSIKEEAFKKLDDTEKEMFLKTDDVVLREKFELVKSTTLPSSISFLAEQDLNTLESHKIYLINQLFEIETIISIKNKLNPKESLPTKFVDDDDDEPWMN